MAAPPPDRPQQQQPPEDSSTAPYLCEDIVRAILLRLPPDEPETLFRAAIVCKPWLRTLCDPMFRQSYQTFHGVPPVLGFLTTQPRRNLTRFIPARRFTPGTVIHDDVDPIDARHGLVLLHTFLSDIREQALIVWDPIADRRWEIAPPPRSFQSWSATIMCGNMLCNHLECDRARFLIAFVGCDGTEAEAATSACLYSSASSSWSEFSSTDSSVMFSLKPATVVSEMVFYTTRRSLGKIVSYAYRAPSVTIIDPPEKVQLLPFRDFTLVPGHGGRLVLATLHLTSLDLWEIEIGIDSRMTPWAHCCNVDISCPQLSIEPGYSGTFPVGFSEGHRIIYFAGDGHDGIMSIHISSGRVSLVITAGAFLHVIPFTAFYMPPTPCLAGILSEDG